MARTTHKKPGDNAGGAAVSYEAPLLEMDDTLRGIRKQYNER